MELQFEVAVTLLPLVGRCVELVGGEPGVQHGNWLGTAEDCRVVIADVARRWSQLDPAGRAGYGSQWRAAVAAFTIDYVDAVEAGGTGSELYEQRSYELTMASVWYGHAARLKPRAVP